MYKAYEILKPAFKGLLLRDPKSKVPLNENGEEKPLKGKEGRFWRRRIADGTAVIVTKKAYKKNLGREEDK